MGARVAPPRWLKHVNKLLMVLLRLGVPISRRESPVVLTAPGRRTGRLRSTPITPMPVDGHRYVVNAYPGATGTADELEGLAGRLAVFRIDPIT